MSVASQRKCDVMFSDPESNYIWSYVGFSFIHLIYILLLIVYGSYPLTSNRGSCNTLL